MVVAFCPLGFVLAPKFRLVASSVILVNRFFHRYTLKFISIVLSMAKVSTMVFARWKHLFSLENNELVALNSPMVAPPFENNIKSLVVGTPLERDINFPMVGNHVRGGNSREILQK